MRCAACDVELTTGARFCASCGAPARSTPEPEADPLRTALEHALGFQYHVERLLGRGGMGAVYLARELALDREVAIKVLPPDRGADADGRARFRREARTAARLSHPHIVPLITFGEVAGLSYYVMGYVPGDSLASLAARGGLPLDTVARLLAEVADALDYAHRMGVVHRDVKPENVLVEEGTGRAVLTDFGIARITGSMTLTATGMVVGTPRYMSPEQAGGAPEVDGRSDLYSLGLIGYELVGGRSPFEGRTPAEQIVQRLTKEVPSLAELAPDAPDALVAAISRCLARDPDARWPDARTFRQHLLAGPAESDLPAPLTTLANFAHLAIGSWIAVAGFVIWGFGSGQGNVLWHWHGNEPEPELTALALAATPLLVLLMATDLRRRGHPWRAMLRAIRRQPRWWMGWYPRRWRAPHDVWDRLPAHVRLVRAARAALLVVAPLLALVVAIDVAGMDTYSRTGRWPGWPGYVRQRLGIDLGEPIAPMALALAGLTFMLELRSRRRLGVLDVGLDDTWAPIYSRSTANRAFWSRPPYASLLGPAAPLPVPRTPGPVASDGATLTRDGPTR